MQSCIHVWTIYVTEVLMKSLENMG